MFASTHNTGFSAIGLHSIWPAEATLVQGLSPIHAAKSRDDSQQAEFLCNLFSCLAESLQSRQQRGTHTSPTTKYLQLPVAVQAKPPTASSKTPAVTGARVLICLLQPSSSGAKEVLYTAKRVCLEDDISSGSCCVCFWAFADDVV